VPWRYEKYGVNSAGSIGRVVDFDFCFKASDLVGDPAPKLLRVKRWSFLHPALQNQSEELDSGKWADEKRLLTVYCLLRRYFLRSI
jgi:hypothetical protein